VHDTVNDTTFSVLSYWFSDTCSGEKNDNDTSNDTKKGL
jgi:hypothetical protein